MALPTVTPALLPGGLAGQALGARGAWGVGCGVGGLMGRTRQGAGRSQGLACGLCGRSPGLLGPCALPGLTQTRPPNALGHRQKGRWAAANSGFTNRNTDAAVPALRGPLGGGGGWGWGGLGPALELSLEVEEGDQLCPPSDPQTRPGWAISGDPCCPWWASGAGWAGCQAGTAPGALIRSGHSQLVPWKAGNLKGWPGLCHPRV